MKKDQSHHSTSLFNTIKDTDFTSINIESKGKNYVCYIDKEDYNLVNQYRWNLQSNGYAVANINGKSTLIHRLVMGVVDDPSFQVDHIRHNKLDNRKQMLRLCSASENRRNSQKHMKASSQFKGVYNDQGKWHVQIFHNRKVRNKGRYSNEKTAAKVYDYYALEHFKDFAYLNFPSEPYCQQMLIPGFL